MMGQCFLGLDMSVPSKVDTPNLPRQHDTSHPKAGREAKLFYARIKIAILEIGIVHVSRGVIAGTENPIVDLIQKKTNDNRVRSVGSEGQKMVPAMNITVGRYVEQRNCAQYRE